jgi:hypothetical protein
VHAAKSAKASGGDANTFEIGQFNAPIIADHYVLDMSLAVDEGTDLAACFVRQFTQLPCEFRSNNLVGRYASSVQLFDAPQLIWFEPESVA